MPRKTPDPPKGSKKKVKLTAREAAEVVLLQNGKPMHYREISRVAIEQGIVKVRGGKRRPDPAATTKTVCSYLCAEEGTKFVRLAPGVFDFTPEERKRRVKAAKAAERSA